jgi:hypothetical protein
MSSSAAVRDSPPPDAMLRILNPLLRVLLGTPAGRLLKAYGVLRFTGRRTGRALAVVVGVHEVDGALVVFTSEVWRLNFRGGRPVQVRHGGTTFDGTGELIEDPEVVATALQQVLDGGTSGFQLGLKIARGHRVTPADVTATGRAVIRLPAAGR